LHGPRIKFIYSFSKLVIVRKFYEAMNNGGRLSDEDVMFDWAETPEPQPGPDGKTEPKVPAKKPRIARDHKGRPFLTLDWDDKVRLLRFV
jgi:hypothetical protein